MNNLQPDMAENPRAPAVYGFIVRAARTRKDSDMTVASLRDLAEDQTLLVQSQTGRRCFRPNGTCLAC